MDDKEGPKTLYDKKIHQLKNNKWIVSLLLIFIIIISTSKVLEVVNKSISNVKEIKEETFSPLKSKNDQNQKKHIATEDKSIKNAVKKNKN